MLWLLFAFQNSFFSELLSRGVICGLWKNPVFLSEFITNFWNSGSLLARVFLLSEFLKKYSFQPSTLLSICNFCYFLMKSVMWIVFCLWYGLSAKFLSNIGFFLNFEKTPIASKPMILLRADLGESSIG